MHPKTTEHRGHHYARHAHDFLAAPPTLRAFAGPDGDPTIELLEMMLEQIIDGTSPFRDIALVGPTGSGKRALANAIGRELCERVVEVDPPDILGAERATSLLTGLREGDALVVHNIDECGVDALAAFTRAIIAREALVPDGSGDAARLDQHLPWRGGPHLPGGSPRVGRPLANFVLIATTNISDGMPPALTRRMLCFSVQRSERGSAAAMTRALRRHGVDCGVDAAGEFGRMLAAVPGDPFAAVVSMCVARARSLPVPAIDRACARTLLPSLWRLVPTPAIRDAVREDMARHGCGEGESIAALGIPESLRPGRPTGLQDGGSWPQPDDD